MGFLQSTKERHIAIIAIQETWLKKHHTIVESQIQGYKDICSVRAKRKGGGASLYILEEYTVLKSNSYSNKMCEVEHAKIEQHNCNVISIYPPPAALVDSFTKMN